MPFDAAAIVAEARSWVGTPYHHQASLKGIGCDCLGLLRGIWRSRHGPEPEVIPAYSRDWTEARCDETLLEAGRRHLIPIPAAEPGDVLIFRMRAEAVAKHAGILVAPSRFVHAQERVGTVEVSLSPWWRRRIAGTFRFPEMG